MRKDKEMRLARVLYVDQRKTAKEIAHIIEVSEKTVGAWVQTYGWRAMRDAKQNAPDMMIKNVKDLLQQLAQDRMDIDSRTDLNEAKKQKEKARIADEVSKWTKALVNAQKENMIPLGVYLKVMEMIFDAIRDKLPKIYLQLIDFQEQHIQSIASKYQ